MSGYDLKLYQPAGAPARSIIVENNYFKNLFMNNTVESTIRNNRGNRDPNSYTEFWDIQDCRNLLLSNNRIQASGFNTYSNIAPLTITRSKDLLVEANNIYVSNQADCRYEFYGVYLENDTSSIFRINTIVTNGICSNNASSYAFFIYPGNRNLSFFENRITQKGLSNGRYGFYLLSTNDSLYFRKNILKNEDVNYTGIGIYFTSTSPKIVEIDSNDIRNYQQAAIDVRPPTFTNYKIRNNVLVGNRDKGININGPGATILSNRIWGMRAGIGINVTASNTTIANNYIHAGGSGLAKGIVLQTGASGSKVVFNSVNINSTDIVNGVGLEILGGTNYVIKNNILSNTGGGYALYATAIPALKEWDYNAYHSSGNNFGYLVNQPYANLSQWGTALSGDANGRKLNPNFPTDSTALPYQKQLNGAGISSSGILLDIDGDLRNQQAPDIGAKEFLVD
jgi:hypothetical protein